MHEVTGAANLPSFRILPLERFAKSGNGVRGKEEHGRPSAAAAADVRAPLEAVELQTGACSEQLWLMLAAERRRGRERELGGHDM